MFVQVLFSTCTYKHIHTRLYMCMCYLLLCTHIPKKHSRNHMCAETKMHTQSNLKKIYTRNYMCACIK